MTKPDPIAIMARAMSASKAWPVVFDAGSGTTLARAALSALHEAGFVVVPQSAIDWLDGAAPDADGKWFGDDVTPGKPYWWRTKFRAMITAAQVPHDEA